MFRVTFFVGVGRVCSVEDVEQSLRDLGLVALTRALFSIRLACLLTVACVDSNLRKRKTGLYKIFLRLYACIFEYFTKEKALDLNSG